MTTRRRPEFLIKTLRSIQRQSFGDFEVIVSDNDPGSSGRAIVEGMSDARFRYYCNGEDLGMNASFNRSLSRATGMFVVMITDDDPVYPEMLETARNLALKYPGYGAYFGGCDVFQVNPEIARFTLHKVGHNSCLAQLPWGAERLFSAQAFPHAFFSGELDMYMLWSVGIIKREIAQSVGGLPDYGSPYLGDFAFTVNACSREGCVITNQSLGCQTVHEFNFGRKECDQLKTAVLGFSTYISKAFSCRSDWEELKPKMERFVGQWAILHALFLKQYFRHRRIEDRRLKEVLHDLFKIPFIRRLKRYYYFGRLFMAAQNFQQNARTRVLGRMRKPPQRAH